MTYIPDKELNKFKYKVYHKGTLIDASDSLSDMKQLVEELEEIDKEDGVYTPKSYTIKRTSSQ